MDTKKYKNKNKNTQTNKIPDNTISHQTGWEYESVISVKNGKK
jgi:hypothetical protein